MMNWMPYFKDFENLSKSIYITNRFSDGNLPWQAIRVLLAEKFSVLPSEIDKLSFPEVNQILAVLDGTAKSQERSG